MTVTGNPQAGTGNNGQDAGQPVLMTAGQAAAHLGISERTIRRHIKSGKPETVILYHELTANVSSVLLKTSTRLLRVSGSRASPHALFSVWLMGSWRDK